MQESFEVTGGISLKGTLTPQGAKNEALQVLCAVLLTKEKVTISNVPNILDVRKIRWANKLFARQETSFWMDIMARFHNSLFLGSAPERARGGARRAARRAQEGCALAVEA